MVFDDVTEAEVDFGVGGYDPSNYSANVVPIARTQDAIEVTPSSGATFTTTIDGRAYAYASDAAAAATGSITFIAGSLLVDGETFTVPDGTNPATVFEFDSGGGVTSPNVAVAFTALETAATIATTARAAINGVGAGLAVTAAAPVGAVLGLTNDATGAAGNVAITDTVANVTFTHTGMSGGDSGTAAEIRDGLISDINDDSPENGVEAAIMDGTHFSVTGLVAGVPHDVTVSAGLTLIDGLDEAPAFTALKRSDGMTIRTATAWTGAFDVLVQG